MLNNIISSVISSALNAAMDKGIKNKTLKMAGESAEALGEGDYTFFVSGYYLGLSFKFFTKFIVVVLAFCMVMMCIFDQADIGIMTVCALMLAASIVFRIVTARRMMIVAYRKGEIVIMDRKNELLCRMPSSAIYDADVTWSKVVLHCPWDGKKYVIRRDVRDNDGAVREMLEFYHVNMIKI